jgi:DNA-binding HxlR family transcriptional regulator
VNTATAIEVWMIYCIISTFLILLQNGIVMLIIRELEERKHQPFWPPWKMRSLNKTHTGEKDKMLTEKVKDDAKKFVKHVDKISFLICVIGSLLFTLIYCIIYAF